MGSTQIQEGDDEKTASVLRSTESSMRANGTNTAGICLISCKIKSQLYLIKFQLNFVFLDICQLLDQRSQFIERKKRTTPASAEAGPPEMMAEL